MNRIVWLVPALACGLVAQEASSPQSSIEQLQVQLKSANERISQLEERIKLMTLQQQGAVQFFQAGQALCELDKKQPPTAKTEKP